MSPFEALHGIKCNIPISWDNLIDRVVLGLQSLREMEEQMVKIKQNLNLAHDRQRVMQIKA
jgi:hypothetical protein